MAIGGRLAENCQWAVDNLIGMLSCSRSAADPVAAGGWHLSAELLGAIFISGGTADVHTTRQQRRCDTELDGHPDVFRLVGRWHRHPR